jgi:transposase-like protein
LEAVLPWLYLKGISTGEMQAALEALVGPEAKGLSASTIARLKQVWRAEYETWRQRRLDAEQWVYLWVDGLYSGLRAETQRLCALVVIGVNSRGEKHCCGLMELDTSKRPRHTVGQEVNDGRSSKKRVYA